MAADEHLDLSQRLHDLRGTIQRYGVGLVILDPVSAMLGGTDTHRDGDVRAVLSPVAAVAAETEAAVVGIRHLRTGRGRAIEAGGGSIAFSAAARSVLLVGRLPGAKPDDPRRVLASTKSNLAPTPPSLMFEVTATEGEWGSVPMVSWKGEVELTADDLAAAEPKRSRSRSKRDEAVDFLRDALADRPASATELQEEAAELGLSWRTVERAKESLGVRSEKLPGEAGAWIWFLPENNAAEEGRQPPQAIGGGGLGGLAREDSEGRQDRQYRSPGNAGGLRGETL